MSQAFPYESPRVSPVPALRSLRSRFKGAVIEPGRDGWDAATQAFNLTVVQQPALVAVPADAEDVIEIVDFARANGMQVAAQRTGHNAEPLGALDDVILVKTDELKGVEIDAERRVARVGAGSKWADVVPPASDLGLAALHGSTPDVSVAGYSLGGGVGWYARKLGLSTNSIAAIELVTADGRLRRVDADTRRRPVLGAARRRRQLRHRHRARGRALLDPGHLRGRPLLPVGAVIRGAARVAGVDGHRPGRGHLGRAHPPVPAARRDPGAAARRQVRDRRGRVHGRRGLRVGSPEAAPRPRPGDGHVRDGGARRHRRSSTWIRRSPCRTPAKGRCSGRWTGRRSTASSPPPGPSPAHRSSPPRSGTSVARSRGRSRTTARCPRSTPTT